MFSMFKINEYLRSEYNLYMFACESKPFDVKYL